MKLAVELTPVEETLLVPLWARAEESTRSDPVLVDPRARGIRARLDFDFDKLADARASQLGCCVRSAALDRWVMEHLAFHPHATVVELGCGLDSRFERVDDGRVRWFDLDLPDVIQLRRDFYQDHDRRRMLAASVNDDAWMDEVAATGDGRVLFVTEGMLPYLSEAEARSLFVRLADRFPGCTFLFDVMAPIVLRHQDRHDAMRHFDARFTWGLRDLAALEGWDARIALRDRIRFHDLMAAHGHRVPRLLRWAGTALGTVYPPLKRAYTLCRAQLGEPLR